MLTRSVTIGLVAGETSGDVLGAGLIRTIRSYLPEARFVGIIGPRMQAEGGESWYDIEELSVMGITEVIKRLPRLLRIRRDITRRFVKLQPDVFVGIDAPDFTITLEGRLKRFGIRTIHYVSPSIWAWRKSRVFKIGRSTDNILVLLPFEKTFYDQHNIPCQFIGHVLADTIPLDPDKTSARKELGIPNTAPCLALLPGSRYNEVKMLSADFLRAAEIVKQCFSDLEIVIPLVNRLCRTQFEQILAKVTPTLSVRLLDNQSHQAMIAADAALLASGTASLECMLAKCPMVVGYRMKPITFALVRRLVKINWVSLPNLLAGYELVTELLQRACRSSALAEAIIELLNNNTRRVALLTVFRQLHQQIRCNANEQAARAVLSLINK